MSAKSSDSGPGGWLPDGATPKRRPAARQSKPRKPAARKAAASGARTKNTEWLPSSESPSATTAEPTANGAPSAKAPKTRLGLKLERRKLAGQLRDARQQLEKERRRSAELTAELDQLKKKRMVSKPKRSASRSRKKAPAKRRPKSSP